MINDIYKNCFDIKNIEDYGPSIANQLRLAQETEDLEYFKFINENTPVKEIRIIRLFLQGSNLSCNGKISLMNFLNATNGEFNEILENVDARKINDDNIDACKLCVRYKSFPSELYVNVRKGTELLLYIAGLLNKICIEDFKCSDSSVAVANIIKLKQDGFDIDILKNLSSTKVTTIFKSVQNNKFNKKILDNRVTDENIEYIDYFLYYDMDVDKILDRTTSQIKSLYSLMFTNKKHKDLFVCDYDAKLFNHLLIKRLNDIEINEEKLIEFELNCKDQEKREKIFDVWRIGKISDEKMQFIIDNYTISQMNALIKILAWIKDKYKLKKFLEFKFNTEQLETISKFINFGNNFVLDILTPNMSIKAIENVFKLVNKGADISKLCTDDFEENFEDIFKIIYLRNNCLGFNKKNYKTKYINYTNKDIESLIKLIKGNVLIPSDEDFRKEGRKYEILDYLIEYNKYNKPLTLTDYKDTSLSLSEIKTLFPIVMPM